MTDKDSEFRSLRTVIKELDLDMTHWINQEMNAYLSRNQYERLRVNLRHIIPELESYTMACPRGHEFVPNWLKKRFPASTVIRSSGEIVKEIPFVSCPICGERTPFPVSNIQCTRNLNIYGDEAVREVNGKTVFVYSFVSFSGSSERIKEFEREFIEIKRFLSPSYNPESWVFHTTKILSGTQRYKEPELQHLKFEDVIDGVSRLSQLIAKFSDSMDLNIYSAVGVCDGFNLKKKERLVRQEDAYIAAFIQIIRETTKHGLAPKFFFERTNSDGWAKTLCVGGRATLQWTYMTHGLPVMSPRYVSPDFNLFLEIADFVNYVIARHLYCIGRRAEGYKNVREEINPESLGFVRYLLATAEDDWARWNYHTVNGFPDEAMFKGTAWEDYICG